MFGYRGDKGLVHITMSNAVVEKHYAIADRILDKMVEDRSGLDIGQEKEDVSVEDHIQFNEENVEDNVWNEEMEEVEDIQRVVQAGQGERTVLCFGVAELSQ